jgi:hypothetical protein
MDFTLTGFTQIAGFRVFAYEGIAEDRVRIKFTVRADLTAIRKYNIRLQDLPLMCRGILERGRGENPQSASRAFTFTEDQMSSHLQECVALRDAAALRRRAPRRMPSKAADVDESRPWNQVAPQFAKPAFGRN